MPKWSALIFVAALTVAPARAAYAQPATTTNDRQATEHFESRVRPLLLSRCVKCHGNQSEGGLRLDTRAAALRGGDSGPAVVPGKPKQSLLIRAVERHDEDLQMPPDKPLKSREVAALKQWIRQGAVWPAGTAVANSGRVTAAQRAFWSFQPIRNGEPPRPPRPPGMSAQRYHSWMADPIDRFVLSRLSANNLAPVTTAKPRTLVRRATFDLTGLPPSISDVEQFVAAWRRHPDTAWQQLIDRLLASPAYGERWGRHWLDLVRYADTAGDAADFPIPEAYKYRNYVIRSFNQDKPYDQFTREQIAGDLLPASDDDQRWEQTIATGYLAISRRIGVSPHNLRHVMFEDTLDNLGKTFLGLTLACARCHDHKFDPIPTSDYYALYGILDSSVFPHVGAEHRPWRADFVYRIGDDAANRLLGPLRAELESWNKKERAKLEEYRDFQRRKVTDGRTRESAWREVLAVRQLRRAVAERFPNLEIAYAVRDGDPRDAHVQRGGDASPRSRGPLVPRGFLQVLGGERLPSNFKGSGRRELAEWIARADNPLTARVMVNRIWHHHFGRGLVRSTSDFGVRGTPPTHPDLLDYLAAQMIRSDWSIKRMHRAIMLSQTYRLAAGDDSNQARQNARLDPDNRWFWRANRNRLDAEQIRDSILSFSDSLDRSPGGRHPFPHRLTYFYRQHEPFVGDFPTNRRSVYLMQQRIRKNEYLDLFDGPDGNLHAGRRKSTTTTLQALFFLNSEFLHEHARRIAGRLIRAGHTTPQRVDWAYRTIFGRPPTEIEVSRAEAYVAAADGQRATAVREDAAQIERESSAPGLTERDVWSGYLRSMLSSNEFMFVD